MAMEFDPRGWNRRPVYLSVTGVITQMQMMSANGSGYGGCTQMITVENEEGGITNFLVNGNTYVVNFETLYETAALSAAVRRCRGGASGGGADGDGSLFQQYAYRIGPVAEAESVSGYRGGHEKQPDGIRKSGREHAGGVVQLHHKEHTAADFAG